MRPRVGDDGEFEEEVDAGYGIYEQSWQGRFLQRLLNSLTWVFRMPFVMKWMLLWLLVALLIALGGYVKLETIG